MDDIQTLLLSLLTFLVLVVAILIAVIVYLLKQKRKAYAQNVTESSKVQIKFHEKTDEADEEECIGLIECTRLENESNRKRTDNTKTVDSQTDTKTVITVGTSTKETQEHKSSQTGKLIEFTRLENENNRKRTDNTKTVDSQTDTKTVRTVGTSTEETQEHKSSQAVKKTDGTVLQFNYPKGNKNLGNTCFFNSSLQALSFTKSFREAIICLKPKTGNFKKMSLTKTVSQLLEKQTIHSENHTKELDDVLSAVGKINEQFGRGTQEDSYELLNTLLSGIFDEIINNADITRILEKAGSLIDVRNLFKGTFIMVYVYDSCNHVEVDIEEFTTLSIPIVDQFDDFVAINHHGFKTVTFAAPLNGVENGLAAFTQIEVFEEQQLTCRICDLKCMDGTGKSYRRILVFQPPPVLVIHVDRYEMNGSSYLTKNSKQLSYSKRLDVSKFCSIANTTMSKQDYIYELYAVVVHTGAISGGHYYAFVNTTRKHDVKRWEHLIRKSTGDIVTLKREAEIILQEKRNINEMRQERTEEIAEVKPNWYYVSDLTVTPVSEEDVLSHKDAYILFYEVQ